MERRRQRGAWWGGRPPLWGWVSCFFLPSQRPYPVTGRPAPALHPGNEPETRLPHLGSGGRELPLHTCSPSASRSPPETLPAPPAAGERFGGPPWGGINSSGKRDLLKTSRDACPGRPCPPLSHALPLSPTLPRPEHGSHLPQPSSAPFLKDLFHSCSATRFPAPWPRPIPCAMPFSFWKILFAL